MYYEGVCELNNSNLFEGFKISQILLDDFAVINYFVNYPIIISESTLTML